MPYANNEGIRIHYEVEGQGPVLLLVHKFSSSIKDWCRAGYVDALKSDYQLVLVDARGHGASDKPHDPKAYEISTTAGDMVAVLDDLGIERACFWGYSNGGRIGFGIGKHNPNRFHSLIIGGMHPYKRDPETRNQNIRVLMQGMEAVIAERESQGAVLTPEQKAEMLANDNLALAASTTANRDDPGLDDALSTMALPCLLYVGEADEFFYEGVKECVKLIPNATFFTLPGLDHGGAFDRIDLVLPHVTEFLSKAGREPAAGVARP